MGAAVKRLKVENRRTRILTPDEQRRLLEATPRKLRSIVMLALITGARVGELLAVKWENVDALTFLETKNGKARPLPLSDTAKAVLREYRPIPGRPYVFTNPVTSTPFATRRSAEWWLRTWTTTR